MGIIEVKVRVLLLSEVDHSPSCGQFAFVHCLEVLEGASDGCRESDLAVGVE